MAKDVYRSRNFYKACGVAFNDEHLLLIEGTQYNERYRRVLYQDINLVRVSETNKRRITLGVAFIVWFLLALISLAARSMGFFQFISIILATIFVVNFILGKSASLVVETKLSEYPVFSGSRLRKIKKFLPVLIEKIEVAQGVLSEAERRSLLMAQEVHFKKASDNGPVKEVVLAENNEQESELEPIISETL